MTIQQGQGRDMGLPENEPSHFQLFCEAPAPGAWNMAVDEALLEAAVRGRCSLRFYQWNEPTLSLGYFQEYAERRRHPASLGCPAVRRASGGGAILHDLELTYSLAVPEHHPLAATRLHTYRVVHESLIAALAFWGIQAALWEDTKASMGKKPENQPFLCFQRRSPGDVLVGGVKIAGSAQRRCQGAVLQHGSVLLSRSAAAPELEGLFELTGKAISAEELIEVWLRKLTASLAVACESGPLPEEYRRRASPIASEKYATTFWTVDRGRVRPIV